MNLPAWLGEWLSRPLPPEPVAIGTQRIGSVRGTSALPTGLSLTAEQGTLAASFVSGAVLELHVSAPGDLDLPSFSRAPDTAGMAPAGVESGNSEEGWFVRSPLLRLDLSRDPLRLRLRGADGDERAAVELAPTNRGWRALWSLAPGDRVYGLGAKTGPLHRRGRQTFLWARDMVVGERSDPLYSAVPFLLLERGGRWTGALLDSAARAVFDLGHDDASRLSFGPRSGALRLLVFAGPRLADVLAQYASFTGLPSLPPLWALGHHQSRWSYADEDEVLEIAAEFRRRDIPTDAIHLDIHYMRGFRVFTFDPRRFPDPARLSSRLGEQGFRVVAIVDPGVKVDGGYETYRKGIELGHFCRRPNGKPFVMKVWPGDAVFPDLYRNEVRRWWAECLRVYTDAGVAGIWNDMNEPSGWRRAWYFGDSVVPFGEASLRGLRHQLDDGREVANESVHNAYGHLHNQATYDGLRNLRPAERPFVLTRSAFAGSQRYAAQWTGDVLSTWAALRQSLPMIMGLGLSGVSFAGSDIGGFFGDCTPEMYARWIQIGALAPFCRSHTALHTHRQEPWSFGEEVEAIARASLKLRYRLLPYLYTCFWQASATGMPLWRPLFAEFPGEAQSWEIEDQVMVGPALMAAPVLERGAVRRKVFLPAGVWFDWHSGARVDGGREIEVEAPLERMPLFARGETALPTQGDVRHAEDRPEAPLIWEVFLTRAAYGRIGRHYEDDGRSHEYRDGAWRVTDVRAEHGEDGSVLRIGPGRGAYATPRAEAQVRLHAPGLEVVSVDGEAITARAPIRFAHDARVHTVDLRAQK